MVHHFEVPRKRFYIIQNNHPHTKHQNVDVERETDFSFLLFENINTENYRVITFLISVSVISDKIPYSDHNNTLKGDELGTFFRKNTFGHITVFYLM